MKIAFVKSVESKYNFSQSDGLLDLVEKINDLECKNKILDGLKRIYLFVKADINSGINSGINSNIDLENINCIQGESHSKILYYEKSTTHGKLKIEGMHFSGDCPTSLHTHPEYIVDEIISGKLEEKCYEIDDNNLVQSEVNIRQENCFKAEFDPSGNPHRVTALEGPCVVLSLCLGHNQVEVLKD